MYRAGEKGLKKKKKIDRLRSAALVKVKYLMNTGKADDGFRIIFDGVLKDLKLSSKEVDDFIEKNRENLTRQCMEDG